MKYIISKLLITKKQKQKQKQPMHNHMNDEQTLNIFIHFLAQRLANNTENVELNSIGVPVDQTPKENWSVKSFT